MLDVLNGRLETEFVGIRVRVGKESRHRICGRIEGRRLMFSSLIRVWFPFLKGADLSTEIPGLKLDWLAPAGCSSCGNVRRKYAVVGLSTKQSAETA